MKPSLVISLTTALLLTSCSYFRAEKNTEGLIVPIHLISKAGTGSYIGAIKFADSEHGLVIKPHLTDLPEGDHGFHIHEIGKCSPQNGKAGGAAGGHYDPDGSGKHMGPHHKGHKGDLPALKVSPQGIAANKMIAPRLMVKEIMGRSVMIHAHGDNYSDTPKKLGGGGERIACGVIPG